MPMRCLLDYFQKKRLFTDQIRTKWDTYGLEWPISKGNSDAKKKKGRERDIFGRKVGSGEKKKCVSQ